MHLRLYKEMPDIGGVCHAHPPISTTFAAAGIPLDKAFLQEAEETVSSGLPLNAVFDAMPVPGGGISRTFEQDGTVLTVTLLPDSEKGYAVSGWTITRQWEEDNSIGNLWMGE